MVEKEVVIQNKAGIHARPASKLVQLANSFSSKIYIERNSDRINAKSILGIIALGAVQGTPLKLVADGEDEQEAVEALAKLVDERFGEE